MDEKNSQNDGTVHLQLKEGIAIKDPSVSHYSAQISTDVEKAIGGGPPKISVQSDVELPNQNNIVDWDGSQDSQNPQNWMNSRKWTIIILVSAITFNQYFSWVIS